MDLTLRVKRGSLRARLGSVSGGTANHLNKESPGAEEARRLLGFKSKTDTVVFSLQELIRRRRIEELKSLMGSVQLEIDIPESRRRP